jgi:hypothetical protein
MRIGTRLRAILPRAATAAIVLTLAATTAAVAALGSDGSWSGTATYGQRDDGGGKLPMAMRVFSHGRIVNFSFPTVAVRCPNQRLDGLISANSGFTSEGNGRSPVSGGVNVSPNGAFSDHSRNYTDVYLPGQMSKYASLETDARIDGRFTSATRVHGTFTAVTIVRPTARHAHVYRCRSGRVAWTAHHGGGSSAGGGSRGRGGRAAR